MCLELRRRAYSAHGYVILCAQYCNSLARCVHALALFCLTFNAIVKLIESVRATVPATKELVKQCQEEFQGLGKFPGEHHIYIDPEVPPVVQEKERFP